MAESRSRYDEKLALILRTAASTFADKGYHQASIRDISRATGLSLSGLYYYFSSKEELLFLIQDHCFGTILENLEELLTGVDEPRERLRLLIDNHLRFFVGNMKEMKVLSHEADSLSGEYRRRVNAKKKRYTDLCMEILAALSPAESTAALRTATFSLFGMMNWIYNWYRPDRDEPVDRLADRMCRLFLEGYLAGGALEPRPRDAGGSTDESGPSIWRR